LLQYPDMDHESSHRAAAGHAAPRAPRRHAATCRPRHHATWTPATPPLRPFECPRGRLRVPLFSTAKTTGDHSLRKYTILDPSPTQLSLPPLSPHSCEPRALPSTPSNPPNRWSFFFFPNSGRKRRRGRFTWPALLRASPPLLSSLTKSC
jgi:hypothetical protein